MSTKTKIAFLFFPEGTKLKHIKKMKKILVYDEDYNFITDVNSIDEINFMGKSFVIVCKKHLIDLAKNKKDMGGV